MSTMDFNSLPENDYALANNAYIAKQDQPASQSVEAEHAAKGPFKATKNYQPNYSQDAAQHQFVNLKKDYEQAAIIYTPGCLTGRVTNKENKSLAFLFADPLRYLQFEQVQAENAKMVVNGNRTDESIEKYWGNLKKAFNAELQRINDARQASLQSKS